MIHFDNECPQRECWHAVSVVEDVETYRMRAIQSPSLYYKACVNIRTDSERYAELRKLVECWQKNLGQAHKDALIQWKHR